MKLCFGVMAAWQLSSLAAQITVPRDELIIAGVLIGVMLGIPLITFLISGRHRWLAILALNACFLLAFLLGGWVAAFSAVTASVLALLVSAALLRHVFDESTWDALSYQVKLAFGRNKGMQIIEEGKTVLPKEGGQLLGPRTVIVKPNNAVVLERGGQQTRILGPGILSSEPFEYVRRIIDLRPRQEWLNLHALPTRDLMAVDVVADVTYCINIADGIRSGTDSFGPKEKDVLQRLDLHMPEWERATKGVVEGYIRQLIGSADMVDLMRPSVVQRLERQIHHMSNEKCKAWSVNVDTVILERVQPTSDATSGMGERARAAAQSDALRLMAEGYQQARNRGMSDDEIHYEVLRHTLEQIAKSSSTELFLTPELQDLATILRQNRVIQDSARKPEKSST